MKDQLEENGMVMSGISPCGNLPEIIEITKNNFFIAVQFHPEFKTRPFYPHPLFVECIKFALDYNHAK